MIVPIILDVDNKTTIGELQIGDVFSLESISFMQEDYQDVASMLYVVLENYGICTYAPLGRNKYKQIISCDESLPVYQMRIASLNIDSAAIPYSRDTVNLLINRKTYDDLTSIQTA
jgi:hypothetical protein